jgi:hypothetical protein
MRWAGHAACTEGWKYMHKIEFEKKEEEKGLLWRPGSKQV